MGTPTTDSPEVLARFREGLPAVKPIAIRLKRSLGRVAELDDLISYGQAGLLAAARRYDPERGVPFRAFANFRIRGAMLDGIRQLSHLPRRVHERLKALESAAAFSEGVAEDLGTPPPPGQTAEDRERKLVEHLAGMATAIAIGLISETATDDQGAATAVAPWDASPEEYSSRQQLLDLVEAAITALPEQEGVLIRRHYLEGERFDHVAAELGLSKSWASRLHTRAIGRLTKRLAGHVQ
ncbi:MAG TPA: sigma-70 family RNA polymerase sigma factor [Polyangiaceae bacterium]|jgi:RNA polymerase sigma factor for flagellar operon FliA|nr:sigma-70 family RNA polymerase sigma factor [Polyangiaceae bacterium]